MKIHVIIVLVLLSSMSIHAQEPKGIEFETSLSWAQIKEKALKENKYIFLDGFTTWCGPCKMMAKEIFPQPNVGEFFNKNFINVAIQFDVTKKDKPDVKRWYKDAVILAKAYKITSFPTYLFFNPNGELVHSILEGSQTAEEFLAKSKMALDPNMQYLSLKHQYEAGNKKPDFLLTFLKTSIKNQKQALIPLLKKEYLASQKDLSTPENLKVLALITSKSTDPGFSILNTNIAKADRVLGKGKTANAIRRILFDEIVLNYVKIGSEKMDYGGGMVMYSGIINPNVNWNELKSRLDAKHPELAEQMLLASKSEYFGWTKNWPELNNAFSEFLAKYPDMIETSLLNFYARIILVNSDDPQITKAALSWAKQNLESADAAQKSMCLNTYSSLLYKSGEKQEAIKLVGEAVELSSVKNGALIELLDKMKKGEKTWK